MEFTGTYYTCLDCEYIWDYDDDACPDCGSKQIEDINVDYIKSTMEYQDTDYKNRLKKMLELHDDL